MRSSPGFTPSHRLSFMLPDGSNAFAIPVEPDLALTLYAAGFVVIEGRSRPAVLELAGRALQAWCAELPKPQSIAASLTTIPDVMERVAGARTGHDPWSIVLGANVVFCPGGLEPQFPRARPPPQLALVQDDA